MPAVVIPIMPVGDLCLACGQTTASHRVNGRWVGCRRDQAIGRDTETVARRLRLASLKQRVVKVRPWGIGAES
ncbi:MAG TPA: hypothetical protein VM364_07920 [Vicinamibacterales bacterium]|nr:hypothetical protein [Vicinamibacterales bacterium]